MRQRSLSEPKHKSRTHSRLPSQFFETALGFQPQYPEALLKHPMKELPQRRHQRTW